MTKNMQNKDLINRLDLKPSNMEAIEIISSNATKRATEFNNKIKPAISSSVNFSKAIENRISKVSEPLPYNCLELLDELIKKINSIYKPSGFNTLNTVETDSKAFDFQNELKALIKSLGLLNKNGLSAKEADMLINCFWVLPYDMQYEDLKPLIKFSREEVDTKMLNHFNDARVDELFEICIKNEPKKDKQILLIQVKDNFKRKNFSVCNVALISYLDGLTLALIDESSDKKHTSHKVINNIEEYYEVHDSYDMYLNLGILAGFYCELYKTDDLKKPASEFINRNDIAHGAKFSNEKIDSIRMLNAIWFVQEFIKKTNFNDKFILGSSKEHKGYIMKP